MKIVWNERSARWFRDASDYTGFNRKLAALLLESIPRRGTLCDIGCGAALVDFELARHFGSVTCVDISGEILRFVDEDIRRLGLSNITTLCSDGAALDGEWDTVLALFHGGFEAFERYLPLARDRLIVVTHASRVGSFGPKGHKVAKCSDVASTREFLDGIGMKYKLIETSLEYGQPLASLDDAADFIRAYTTPMEDGVLRKYMDERLEKTGREDFPYYLPNSRGFGMFIIRRDENENLQARP